MAGSVFKSSSYPLMFFLSCLSLSCVYSSNGVFFLNCRVFLRSSNFLIVIASF